MGAPAQAEKTAAPAAGAGHAPAAAAAAAPKIGGAKKEEHKGGGGAKGHNKEHEGGEHEHEEYNPETDTNQAGAGHEVGGHEKGGGEGGDKEPTKSPFGFGMTFSKEGFSMAGSYKIVEAPLLAIPIPPTPLYAGISAGLSVAGGMAVPWKKPNFSVGLTLAGDIAAELGCGQPMIAAVYGKFGVGVAAPMTFTVSPETWKLAGGIEAESHFRCGIKLAGGIVDFGFNFGKLELFKMGFDKSKGQPFKYHNFQWGPELVKLGEWISSAAARVKGLFSKVGQKIKGFFSKLKAKLTGGSKPAAAPAAAAPAETGDTHIDVDSVEKANQEITDAEKNSKEHEEASKKSAW